MPNRRPSKRTATPAPTNAPRRYALYARCSTDEQAMRDYSTIDTQTESLTRYVAEQGGVIAATFADEGKSGTTINRPGFKSLLAAAQRGEFDTVAVTFGSRLGRGDAFTIARYKLEEAGVSVETIKESFGEGIGGYMGRQVQTMMDGLYPKIVREHTIASMQERFAQGYHCAGAAPFGYVAVPIEGVPGKTPPKRLVPDPDNAAIVQAAFETFVYSDGDTTATRRQLTKATGETWTVARTRYLLRNRVYRGVATWGSQINEAAHLPIVDADTFGKAQTLLDESAARPRTWTQDRKPGKYYLRGHFYCACGAVMTPYWSRGRHNVQYPYYQCVRAVRFASPCPLRQIAVARAHDAVMGEMSRMGKTPWRVRRLLENAAPNVPDTARLESEVTAARRALKAASDQCEKLTEAIRLSPTSLLPRLLREMENAQADEDRARAMVAEREKELSRAYSAKPTAHQLQTRLTRFAELWEEATEEERAEIVALTIGRVTLLDKKTVEVEVLGDEETAPKSPALVAHERDGSIKCKEQGG